MKAVEDVIFRRHDEALRFVIPWVLQHIDLPKKTIVEIGAGSGSSSLAFSHCCSKVKAYDIDGKSSIGFLKRKELFDSEDRLTFKICESGNLIDVALEDKKPGDVILFYAVVEHLTIEERLKYLGKVWRALDAGEFLIVVEMPNRLAYFDGHTSRAPFLHFLPDELLLSYLKYFKHTVGNQDLAIRFGDTLLEAATQGVKQFSLTRVRVGLGVSFHEFEIAFGCNLNDVVIADGFDQPIINWFPVSVNYQLLLSYWGSVNHDIPAGFARSVLSFIFYKPKDEGERRRIAADNRRKSVEIKKIYSLTGQLENQGLMLEERWATIRNLEAIISAQASRADSLGAIARFSIRIARLLKSACRR